MQLFIGKIHIKFRNNRPLNNWYLQTHPVQKENSIISSISSFYQVKLIINYVMKRRSKSLQEIFRLDEEVDNPQLRCSAPVIHIKFYQREIPSITIESSDSFNDGESYW